MPPKKKPVKLEVTSKPPDKVKVPIIKRIRVTVK